MKDFLNKIIGDIDDKKAWRAIEARAKKLPQEYRIVYKEIKRYVWSSVGLTSIEPFKVIVDLFEESAANSKPVLEVTGEDVAAFCDEVVRGEKTYTKDWRDKLNSNIAKKLKQ